MKSSALRLGGWFFGGIVSHPTLGWKNLQHKSTLLCMTTAQDSMAPLTLDDLRREGTTVSVERSGQYLGVSRAFAYQMAREGQLPTIKLGTRRVRVPTAALL